MPEKIVFKNIFNKNKFKMRNRTVSNKAKGGLVGSLIAAGVVIAGNYFGMPIPEEVASEFATGLVALGGFIGSWFASPDDPNDIETTEEPKGEIE